MEETQEPLVGIAGTGHVAKALGALLVRSGVQVSAVAGRDNASAREAADFIGAGKAVPLGGLPRYANRILIAVTDSAIGQVAAGLAAAGLREAVVLHTSGAAGPEALDALREAGNSTGVIHPLQTVPDAERGMESLVGATFAFAGDEEASAWAEELIDLFEGRPLPVNPAFWRHYHAAAAMACNYQMTLVDAALELMQTAGIGRAAALHALGPILRTTTHNILTSGPEAALTGPIRRGDTGTIRGHLGALETASKETRDLYIAAGLRTIPLAARAGLPAEKAKAVAAVLESAK